MIEATDVTPPFFYSMYGKQRCEVWIFVCCYDRQMSDIAYFFGSQEVSLKTPFFRPGIDMFFDVD